jgi:orotidine-5'-phosphate decarboxylase
MKTELIVALDIPGMAELGPIVHKLSPEVDFFKVGLELFTAEGPRVLEALRGQRIFLDLKMHDIPRTVERSVASAARLGVQLLTVHAGGGSEMLRAAAAGAAGSALKLVAVTTLTSLGEADLRELGIVRPLREHTLALGEMAVAAGIHGLVCSPLEAAEFRLRLGPGALLVTPGIRPAGADAGDQKRIATPAAAVQAGASHIVVGRPILEAPDPRAAALAILSQMKAATSTRKPL